jgi:hypothetical protein
LLPCLAIGLASYAIACGGSPARQGASPQNFPPYTGQATALFDDRIDASAVGLADVASKPRSDPALRARAQTGEAVSRVRVATVSVDSVGGRPNYHLTLDLLDGALVRRGFADEHVDISIGSDSPAFGVVKWLDTRLIGRTFIGFFHRYAGTEGPQLRFHLSPDNPDVLGAVHEAAVLSEVSGK